MQGKTIKILVISNTPWRMDNSFGNTFNAFFEGAQDFEIANIYCRAGEPDEYAPVSKAFQITEHSLIANLLNSHSPSGHVVTTRSASAPTESTAFNAARKRRWQLLFWARDLIWKIGRWESKELVEFVDTFDPDVLFLPVYYSNYLCDIDSWAIGHCDIPVFTHISDDIYSLRQINISPLFWIDRVMKRHKIKKVVNQSNCLYVISEIQRSDYQMAFSTPVKVIKKGFVFGEDYLGWEGRPRPIKLLYAGNIGTGRWRSLADITSLVSSLNNKEIRVTFDVYTPTPIDGQMKNAFEGKTGVSIHGPISAGEVVALQRAADVLIHVESFKTSEKLAVRQSLSTKIPDCLKLGKCILAYGPEDVASIDYLVQSNSAVVATDAQSLEVALCGLLDGSIDVKALGKRAFAFARANHNKIFVQSMLRNDFKAALNSEV